MTATFVITILCTLSVGPVFAEEVRIVADINEGSGSSFPTYLTAVGDTLYFAAQGHDSDGKYVGYELFKATVDGGAELVKNIAADQYDPDVINSSNPGKLTHVDGLLFFEVASEVWVSEGTAATTEELSDKVAVYVGTGPSDLTACNGCLYYSGIGQASRRELWYCSESNGTYTVEEIVNPDENDPALQPDFLTDVNGTLYFGANDDDYGRELWCCSGTTPSPVANIKAGNASSFPHELTVANEDLYFVADNDTDEDRLYRYDPTLSDLDLISGTYSEPEDLTDLNGALYFRDDSNGTLWKVNGTTATQVATNNCDPRAMTYASGAVNPVLFSANYATYGRELCCETASGVSLVKDVNTGSGAGIRDTAEFHVSKNGLLLFAGGPDTDTELWISDGDTSDTSGTYRLANINSQGSSNPAKFTTVGRTIYFVATDVTHGTELFCVSPGPPGLVVRDASDEVVGAFYANGDIVLKGQLTDGASTTEQLPQTTNPEFVVCDSNGAVVARLDSSTGNLYIKGGAYEEQASITLTADPEFVLKDADGVVVCVINEDGDLKTKGTVLESGMK